VKVFEMGKPKMTAAMKAAAKRLSGVKRSMWKMTKSNRRILAAAIAFSLVALVVGFAFPVWLRTTTIIVVNGTNGTDGNNGVNGNDGVSGFNSTAADYVCLAAIDQSWFAAVPGRSDLPFVNESTASVMFDATILALNSSAHPGGTISVLNNRYPIVHTILLAVGVTLDGSGVDTILQPLDNFSVMVSDSGNSYAIVRDISVVCTSGDNRVGVGINATGTGFVADNVWVSNFTVAGISAGDGVNLISKVTLSNCYVGPSAGADTASSGINVARTTDTLLDHCLVDSVNGTGIVVNASTGTIVDRCTSNYCNGSGVYVDNSSTCSVHDGWVNASTGDGVTVRNTNLTGIAHYYFTTLGGKGLNMTNVRYMTISAIDVVACAGGIYTYGCANSSIETSFFTDNTGKGFSLDNCNYTQVSLCHAVNNVGNCSDSGALSNYNIVVTCYLDGIKLVGAADIIASTWVGYGWVAWNVGAFM
jgi:hypothetical protein